MIKTNKQANPSSNQSPPNHPFVTNIKGIYIARPSDAIKGNRIIVTGL
jgi:hypothetical protein